MVLETLELINRIIEFRIGVRDLLTVNHKLKTLREFWVIAVLLAQWRHLNRVVGDVGWLDVVLLTLLAEDFVDELSFTHGFVHFKTDRFRRFAHFVFCLAV